MSEKEPKSIEALTKETETDALDPAGHYSPKEMTHESAAAHFILHGSYPMGWSNKPQEFRDYVKSLVKLRNK